MERAMGIEPNALQQSRGFRRGRRRLTSSRFFDIYMAGYVCISDVAADSWRLSGVFDKKNK